jgi:phosphonate metabolism protein PhnN/1,5-bisphosphokinase (PRPP-forming)
MAPGTLFLVLGPSGAGKDTCLDGAREIMTNSPHTVFAKRWITRDPDKCSDLEMPVTPNEMDLKSDMCELALFWEAHDTMYAVGNEIKVQLAQGINVVINVSRTCEPPHRLPLRMLCRRWCAATALSASRG